MDYRPDIDGLRGVAILSVMAYHTGISLFAGGMGGVDVFFVISGFLITANILNDLSNDRFSFKQFFENRVRRIFPALFIMLMVTLPFIVLFVPSPHDDYNLKVLLAAVFSVSNFYLANLHGIEPTAGYDHLAHTWSLGVEEQFYIVFPFVLFLIWKIFGWAAWRILLVFAIASFLWAAYETANFEEANFFTPNLRAWELLIGALLAFLMKSFSLSDTSAEIASITGLSMIVITVFFLSESVVIYPGPLTIVPTLGAALIILSGANRTRTSQLLSRRPLVFVGIISYSLYLWHNPIFEFVKAYTNTGWNMGFRRAIVASAASLCIAYVSWRYVETPFRGRNSPISRFQMFTFFGGLMAAFLVVVQVLVGF